MRQDHHSHPATISRNGKSAKPSAMTDIDEKPPRIADASFRFIGKPVRRKEDERLLTGKGRFSDDFSLDGQAYAVMVRSPHPHARIVASTRRAPSAMPGVLGVFTGADCRADGLAADPARSAAEDQIRHEAHRARRRHGLHRPASAAAGRQGAPCRRGGRDGGGRDAWRRRSTPPRRSRSTTRSCPASTDSEDAHARPARRRCGTRCRTTSWSTPGSATATATDRAFAARRPCRARWTSTSAASPACRWSRARRSAHYDADDRPLHALCRQRRRGAAEARARRACSAFRPRTLRVLSYDVGGNFGTRNRRLCRVRPGAVGRRASSAGRSNTPRRARKRSSPTTRAAISSPRSSWRCARTAASSPCAPTTSAMSARAACRCRRCRKGSGLITGSYDIPAATLRARAVFTNTMPTKAYRSSGRPEVTFAIERLIDIAATRARHRPHRAAPQEPRARRRRCPTATRSA